MSIISLLATLCFVAAITLQVLELMHFSADPSVWP